MVGNDPLGRARAEQESRLRRRRIERECRRQKRFAGRFNAHAGGQRRRGAAGIVIVIVVALLFDGDLSIELCEGDQQASGGRTPFARTDPWRHQQPQYDKNYQQRAQVKHDNVTSSSDSFSVGSNLREVNARLVGLRPRQSVSEIGRIHHAVIRE